MKNAPETMKAFWAFDKEAFKDGAIDVLHKPLMAVAVALTAQCPYCIELHVRAARQAGGLSMSSFIDFHLLPSSIEELTLHKSRYRRNFKPPHASIGMGQVELLRLEWSRHDSSFLRFIDADQ